MTVAVQERSLPQPHSKSASTVQSSIPDIIAVKATTNSRPPSRTRVAKNQQNAVSADFISKPATLSLIRRVLLKDTSQTGDPAPVEDILPPLTSSNDIDLQLYAIVSIIVKDFVNTWYSKITTDHTFVEEVLRIFAHCSRALEERIRHIDVAELILSELPLLVERHIAAYRLSNSSLAQQQYHVNPRAVYHSLNPHPALDPVPDTEDVETVSTQSESEAVYRQILVNGALAVLLPTEDLQNAPLRILVSDIIADLIIGQAVAGKVCEGWFLHEAVVKVVTALKEKVEPKASGKELQHKTKSRLEDFGLLDTESRFRSPRQTHNQSGITVWFWRIMQWIYITLTTIRFIMQGLLSARHLPKRFRPSSKSGSLKLPATSSIVEENDQSPQPILTYNISNLISTLVRVQDRMPWLSSAILFWQHVFVAGSGHLAATNSILDRFLHHILTTSVFTSSLLTNILIGLRIGVFPNNSLGPPAPPPPSPEERIEIQRRAAKAILSLIPTFVAQQYYNSSNDEYIVQQVEEDILSAFGDKYMNKHLIYGILELFIVRLIPELEHTGVGELLAERGVNWDEAVLEVKDIPGATKEVDSKQDLFTDLGI